MKTRIRHIAMRLLPIMAACLVGLALQGCIYDDGPFVDDIRPVEIPDGAVQVGLRIRLSDDFGSPVAGSRAGAALQSDYEGPVDYRIGSGYENYIGFTDNDFRLMLFDGQGRFVDMLPVFKVIPSADDSFGTEYTVLCFLTKKVAGTFRIVALANWGAGNYPGFADLTEGVTTIADVCESASIYNTYRYNPDLGKPFIPSARTPIPMFGVKTCTDVQIEADKINYIGELNLLRAMAKVEVLCKEGTDLELGSVRLLRYNTKGYCAPAGMYDNTDYVTAPHLPAGAAAGEAETIDFSIVDNRAVIYIPEYANPGVGADGVDRNCRLLVAFADNTEYEYTIDFRHYTDGTPSGGWFDILRNCCYSFTVDRTTEIRVDVVPYGEKWLDPVFGL